MRQEALLEGAATALGPHSNQEDHRTWQMFDGEQVSSMLAVLPETFIALPSTLPRKEQLRLVRRARSTERDTYLWGRDHKAECDPHLCGYVPEATSNPPSSN
ncbi:hypothetical protein ACIBI9_49115 [Nonomuraea sp. NPDC050451]|uniref:hypothetical protein n=1 Tax=Nonomuraea sp. NPDC050451 TaxID=3364364 RepID=UPI003799482D